MNYCGNKKSKLGIYCGNNNSKIVFIVGTIIREIGEKWLKIEVSVTFFEISMFFLFNLMRGSKKGHICLFFIY